ncbi:MAG TPA: glycosyltransferase, partial [Bacteroidia bacterium]|nr:glycosyltransferase [Bacteroidia bacterium]
RKTFILPHGYDPKNIWADKKFKKQCFYASSPDRGLETLLAIWPSIYEKHPDATLLLTYGAPVESGKGIINLGEVDEETMNEIFRTSDFWLHPCNGGELYCITGIKAQVSGCIPVVIPRMALSETVRHGFLAKDESEYVQTLDIALSAEDEQIDSIRTKLLAEKYPTWESTTDDLLKIVNSVLFK